LVGNEDWPFPVPIVNRADKWFFDGKTGRQELLYRRIGANELDAIAICHGYVEAQHDYALQKRDGYEVNQYAQRIISTPGKQDGVVFEKDFGPKTLAEFQKMERFNPNKSWTQVLETDD